MRCFSFILAQCLLCFASFGSPVKTLPHVQSKAHSAQVQDYNTFAALCPYIELPDSPILEEEAQAKLEHADDLFNCMEPTDDFAGKRLTSHLSGGEHPIHDTPAEASASSASSTVESSRTEDLLRLLEAKTASGWKARTEDEKKAQVVALNLLVSRLESFDAATSRELKMRCLQLDKDELKHMSELEKYVYTALKRRLNDRKNRDPDKIAKLKRYRQQRYGKPLTEICMKPVLTPEEAQQIKFRKEETKRSYFGNKLRGINDGVKEAESWTDNDEERFRVWLKQHGSGAVILKQQHSNVVAMKEARKSAEIPELAPSHS